MTNRFKIAAVVLLGLTAMVTACDNEGDDGVGPDETRVFSQVERLGNPLVSEVTFAKRDHGFHNTTGPQTDVSNGFRTKVEAFVTGVAGREASLATTLSGVLIPDMLIVQTDRPGNTAGWLTWALANGYGGRKLSDDVVDAGLAAIFGALLNPRNVSAGLSTDNVNANDKAFGTAFPYLASPN
ncbi:MAG: DUF4331 family protein [Longimicrobiales bacterium]